MKVTVSHNERRDSLVIVMSRDQNTSCGEVRLEVVVMRKWW